MTTTTRKTITAQRLRELLAYDAETGVFTRRVRAGKRWAPGTVAGTVNGEGYLQIKVDGVNYKAHRLALLYVNGVFPDGEVDHINGQKADNRFANLRDVSGSVNCQNLRRSRVIAKSAPLGVSKINRKGAAKPYRARIDVDGKTVSLGCFAAEKDAQAVYLTEKRRSHIGCTI